MARIFYLFFRGAPLREISERSLGGELVVFRKTSLDRKEADEGVDCLLHLVKLARKAKLWQSNDS